MRFFFVDCTLLGMPLPSTTNQFPFYQCVFNSAKSRAEVCPFASLLVDAHLKNQRLLITCRYLEYLITHRSAFNLVILAKQIIVFCLNQSKEHL